jgi:alcohol dehydrogenase
VVGVDVNPAALEMAAQLGAEATVDATAAPNVAAAVRELTDGGAHVSLDALGSAATCVASLRSLRKRGRHVQVGLLAGADARPAVPMGRLIAHELEIVGSHGMAAHDYGQMLAQVESGRLRPDRLVSERIGLGEAGAALAAMGNPRSAAGVTVIVP